MVFLLFRRAILSYKCRDVNNKLSYCWQVYFKVNQKPAILHRPLSMSPRIFPYLKISRHPYSSIMTLIYERNKNSILKIHFHSPYKTSVGLPKEQNEV